MCTRYTSTVDNWRAFIINETLYTCTCFVFKFNRNKKVLVIGSVCQICEFLLNPLADMFIKIIIGVSWRKNDGCLLQDEDENKTCSYVLSFKKIPLLKKYTSFFF